MLTEREREMLRAAYQAGYEKGCNPLVDPVESLSDDPARDCFDRWLNEVLLENAVGLDPHGKIVGAI
jgi:hypothetical protein